MSHTIRFKISNQEATAIQSLLKRIAKDAGSPGQLSIDSFARTAMINMANQLFSEITGESSNDKKSNERQADSSGDVQAEQLAEI